MTNAILSFPRSIGKRVKESYQFYLLMLILALLAKYPSDYFLRLDGGVYQKVEG